MILRQNAILLHFLDADNDLVEVAKLRVGMPRFRNSVPLKPSLLKTILPEPADPC